MPLPLGWKCTASAILSWKYTQMKSVQRSDSNFHQWAATVPPALVLVQSQITADPTKSMKAIARKHSLYAMTNEFV